MATIGDKYVPTNACCYCGRRWEDDAGGVWCGVNWDELEYYPDREKAANAECNMAKAERDVAVAKAQKEAELAMAKDGEKESWKDDPNNGVGCC